MTSPADMKEDYDIEAAGLSIAARREDAAPLPLVHDISFAVPRGRISALIGESGSGKSLTASVLLGLTDTDQYDVSFSRLRILDTELTSVDDAGFAHLRGTSIGYVTQDPGRSLDPTMTVGDQIAELFVLHQGMGWKAARHEAIRALDQVRIASAAARASDYPHSFSGGMKQRIVIAGAIALRPRILIADEPTSALDVTVQAEILALIDELRRTMKMSVLLITHDLGIVYQLADQVLVMNRGEIVERGNAEQICRSPMQDYTRRLIAAVPDIGDAPEQRGTHG
jgi:ABC-type dipeptide/oligopeptide/nickel transport system ATPase component